MDELTPRIPPVPLETAPDDVKPVFDAFMAARGNVPNLYRTLALRPAIMKGYKAMMDAALGQGTVETALKEMVAVRVSLINGCEY